MKQLASSRRYLYVPTPECKYFQFDKQLWAQRWISVLMSKGRITTSDSDVITSN